MRTGFRALSPRSAVQSESGAPKEKKNGIPDGIPFSFGGDTRIRTGGRGVADWGVSYTKPLISLGFYVPLVFFFTI
jgi:hypothetical protein